MHHAQNESRDRAMDTILLVLRTIVGVIFMAHGAQKLFGAFGGPGLETVVQQMGSIGYLVAVGEFFGGLGLLVGVFARFSAAANLVIMVGAIALVHWKGGFFAPAGFEFNLALIGLLAPVVIAGPGRFALGRFLPLPKRANTRQPVPILE